MHRSIQVHESVWHLATYQIESISMIGLDVSCATTRVLRPADQVVLCMVVLKERTPDAFSNPILKHLIKDEHRTKHWQLHETLDSTIQFRRGFLSNPVRNCVVPWDALIDPISKMAALDVRISAGNFAIA